MKLTQGNGFETYWAMLMELLQRLVIITQSRPGKKKAGKTNISINNGDLLSRLNRNKMFFEKIPKIFTSVLENKISQRCLGKRDFRIFSLVSQTQGM